MDLMKFEGKNYLAFLYHVTALRWDIPLQLILSRLITSVLFCTNMYIFKVINSDL